MNMNIKETDLTTSKSSDEIISQMEAEWPLMTKEFKKIQREQYELFLHLFLFIFTLGRLFVGLPIINLFK